MTNNATTYKAWQIFQADWREAKYILGSLMVYSPWLLPVILIVVIAATAAVGLVLTVIVIVFLVVVVAAAPAAAVIVVVIVIRPGKSLYDFKRVWL